MYDDALPNLQSFVELKNEYQSTKFYAWHVSKDGIASEYHRTNEAKNYHFAGARVGQKAGVPGQLRGNAKQRKDGKQPAHHKLVGGA